MPNLFFGNRDNTNLIDTENTLSSNEKTQDQKTPDEKILKIKQLISDYDDALSLGEKLSQVAEPKRQRPKG